MQPQYNDTSVFQLKDQWRRGTWKPGQVKQPSINLAPSIRLGEYVRQAWHVVEPSNPYISGWHLDVISEHLESVTAGKIHRLLINIPPRTMKSLAVAVFWPTWEWTFTANKMVIRELCFIVEQARLVEMS